MTNKLLHLVYKLELDFIFSTDWKSEIQFQNDTGLRTLIFVKQFSIFIINTHHGLSIIFSFKNICFVKLLSCGNLIKQRRLTKPWEGSWSDVGAYFTLSKETIDWHSAFTLFTYSVACVLKLFAKLHSAPCKKIIF